MREKDFPPIRDEDLTYLDSACMSLRPEKVIQAVKEYYTDYPACPGRSHHSMSEKASKKLDKARKKVAEFIGASETQLIFTSGTTESINTVAKGFETDKVFISDREHNSNLVPWQKKDCEVEVLETDGGIDFDDLEANIEDGDLISIVHVSNLDGKELDINRAGEVARENDAYLLVDAAQSVPHMPIDVSEIKVDFMAFSGHKMLGPSGTGGLYVSERAKDKLEPLKTGGGAVSKSTYTDAEHKEFPEGFEAGLPNVAGFIGFGAAVDYLSNLGMEKVYEHEENLTEQLESGLDEIEKVSYLSEGSGVVNFWVEGMDPHQVALMLDRENIAVRSGMHCVHSWFDKKDLDPGVRVSLHLYNTKEDIEKLVKEVEKIAYLA